jgi:spore maturation protein CgeB
MQIAFFGSSLLSAYWNGAATYYRGIIKALDQRGHRTTFYEPDAFERQQHRDIDEPPWAKVVVYPAAAESMYRALEQARRADVIVKASGVGVFDRELEAGVLDLKAAGKLVVFWDVDAPATLERIRQNPKDPLAALIPRYDFIFSYGGGVPVIRAYSALGARECVPIYNALDPETHFAVAPEQRFSGDLALLANRLPDRESRVEEFFLKPATVLPRCRFILGGAGWADKPLPQNVHYVGHVYTRDHNAFNSSPRAVLNVSRDSMARYGYSPATRIFEAAGAGACIITDWWEGIHMFLDPDHEVFVAHNGEDVIECLRHLTPECAVATGSAAAQRVLAHHTYKHRAEQIENVLQGSARVALGA